MSGPIETALLFEYVAGSCTPQERARVDAARIADPAVEREVREAEEALLKLLPASQPPSPSLRNRVRTSVEQAAWGRWADRVSEVWDLSVEAVLAEFRRAIDPALWEAGPVAGVSVFHLTGGPATAGADVGIVRFAPGTRFPRHTHTGREAYILLQGALEDSQGFTEVPGDAVRNDSAISHSFLVAEGDDAVIAITVHGMVEILP